MKIFLCKMIKAFFILSFFILILTSCMLEKVEHEYPELTAKGSADLAKLVEKGASAYAYYHYAHNANVVVVNEYTFAGQPTGIVPGNNSKDVGEKTSSLKESELPGFFGVQYGFGYVGKGAKYDGGSVSLGYLELPIDIMYHLKAGPGHIYGGLGPYFAYGIGGKTGDVSSFGENNGGFKRFDAGIGFLAGYKLNMGVSLDFGYDLGLANVEYASEDVTGHTRNFSINVGYQIGRLFVKKK
ncbi:MAG: PorT family protein [Bacteroidetes bacterium]|nr:PorT family protein [Bacteroidota bacterium]